MRPSMHSFDDDDLTDFTTEFVPWSINSLETHGDAELFLQLTADMNAEPLTPDERSSGNNAGGGLDPHIRRQLNILRGAMESLQSAMSVSNGPVLRALDRVRALVERGTNIDMRSSSSVGATVS